jgi:hypothetical protein
MKPHLYVCLAFCFFNYVTAAAEILAANTAQTQVNSTSLQLEDATSKQNRIDGDIDQEITNPKLRTDSGSKSKFSGSASMNYKGGALSKPFGAERPDLSGLPENQTDSSLDGGLKLRFRQDKNHSFTLGVALGVRTPLQGDVNTSTNQMNVGDPLLGYNYTWAGAWGLQNSANLYASYGTSKESVRIDQFGSIAADYTVMKKIVKRLQAGVTAYSYRNFYETKPGENKFTAVQGDPNHLDRRTDYMLSLSPTIEYYLSDKVALRTMMGFFRWRHLYGDRDEWSLMRIKEYQSIGVGWTVTRDVYLYPNVQFLPRNVRSEYTNVGLTTSINVF